MNTVEELKSKYIFSLDIGTRSVIGIVGHREGDIFKVEAMEKLPHKNRAMVDGQIEDIDEVAAVVKQVKSKLEQTVGFDLEDVYVAAAGRSLKTAKAAFKAEVNQNIPVSTEQIKNLEMNAIAVAQESIYTDDDANTEKNMICVGYSVITYRIDNYKMSTILGHKGKEIEVEIIATFLPTPVVDSLRSAMNKAGLNISNMTLEPIAASNAVIPKELRLLNLALVDIGAGTSDIAISNGGSITAYTMATIAGDEVTETIMQQLLVDFNEAERIKQVLSTGVNPISYTNILGIDNIESKENLLEITEIPVQAIANEIGERILECNGGLPAAIFLVGGGSKSPNIAKFLAEKLEIDETKIAVGGSNYMKKQTDGNIDANDPELATPLGIGISAMNSIDENDINVTVNGAEITLSKTQGCTVMNALLMSGIKYSAIMGKNGKSVTFSLNDKKIVARGGVSRSADILVNNQTSHISTILNDGDTVSVKVYPQGEDAVVTVSDYVNINTGNIFVDNTAYSFGTMALVNGIAVNGDTEIKDYDKIEVSSLLTFGELCESYGIDAHSYVFEDSGERVYPETKLSDNLHITTFVEARSEISEQASTEIDEAVNNLGMQNNYVNEHTEPLTQINEPANSMFVDKSKLNTFTKVIRINLNGETVLLPPKPDKTQYMFLDLFNYVDIDPTKPMGDVNLVYNGSSKNVSYLQKLNDGDTIQIGWK